MELIYIPVSFFHFVIEVKIICFNSQIRMGIFVQAEYGTGFRTGIEHIYFIYLKGSFCVNQNVIYIKEDFAEKLHQMVLVVKV